MMDELNFGGTNLRIDIINEFIKDLREQLLEEVSDLTVDNLSERLPKLQSAINILEEIPLWTITKETSVSNEEVAGIAATTLVELESEEEEVSQEDWMNEQEAKLKTASSSKTIEGALIRELRGGYVEGRYIGESLIRKFHLEHRDMISLTDNNGKPYIESVNKGPGIPREDRVQLDYCIIEEEYGHYFIRSQYASDGGNLIPIPLGEITLSFDDGEKYGEGAIIDIAYYAHNPNVFQIIWQHDTSSYHRTPNTSSFYKRQAPATLINKDLSSEYPELKKTRVLVIGGDDRHADYRDNIEACGGFFTGLRGNANKDVLKTYIRKADVVVIVMAAIRTHTGEQCSPICKELQIPFTKVHNDGVASILRAAANPKSEG